MLAWSGAIVTVSACGTRVAGGGGTDTSTNWLTDCDSDLDCDSGLECRCGVCTRTCQDTVSCGDLGFRAVCIGPPAHSCTEAVQLCLAEGALVKRPADAEDAGDSATSSPISDELVYPVGPPPSPPSSTSDSCYEASAAVEPNEETLFGATPVELVMQFAASAGTLSWSEFDLLPFAVDYTPNAGTTGFQLVELRVTGAAEQLTILPTAGLLESAGVAAADQCNRSRVTIPLSGRLLSSDGNLNEHWTGTATFVNHSYALLSATMVEPLDGAFDFEGAPYHYEGEVLQPHLELSARLWPGGSAGVVWPNFEVVDVEHPSDLALSAVPHYALGSNTTPSGLTSPTGQSQLTGTLDQIVAPEHYGTIASWPSTDVCAFSQGFPHARTDLINGVSPYEIWARSLPASPTFDQVANGHVLAIDWEDLAERLCVVVDGPVASFKHRGRFYNATGHQSFPEPATPVDDVDARMAVVVRYRTDASGLTEVSFGPDLEIPHLPLTREALLRETGITLPENDAYAAYHWSVQGHYIAIPNGLDYTFALQVYGLNLAQVEEQRH